jgi:DNA phosphorothioation-associated putative methyltransferase
LVGQAIGVTSSKIEVLLLKDMKSVRLEPTINRAKTALSRNNFSRPVQHLLESGLLTKKRSFFDYGCGRGDDIAGLTELGYQATGWDPAYHADRMQVPAAIVNLGFVLNVIEDPTERNLALRRAWELTEKALIVSVISIWERPKQGLEEFSDGHLTQRGTFQRYFEPGELKCYVDDLLGIDTLPYSPTSVLCFKDPDMEQEYVARAERGVGLAVPPPSHPLRKSRLSQCIERFMADHPDEWTELVGLVTDTAAPPPLAILTPHEQLVNCGVRPPDLTEAIMDIMGEDEWKGLIERVRNRFLSRLALGFFRGKPKPKHYSLVEREAVKHHFSSFAAAIDRARPILFAIGDPNTIAAECAATNLGVEDEQALFVHRSCIPYISPVLQTYIGAGRLFHGEINTVDVFKIHKASGKLTLLLYDDFAGSTAPILHTRVKINFRARRIDYFNHRAEEQKLKNKAELLPIRSSLT